MEQETEFSKAIRDRFLSLPKVVQHAITSADVSKQMRELADAHKLHLDQWESLENEVQFTLLGIHRGEDLAANIQKAVNLDQAAAESLAADISRVVFDPVRKELERELEHPDAVAVTTTEVEDMRAQMLGAQENKPESAVPAVSTAPVTPAVEAPIAAVATPIAPGTPPTPAPTATVERAPTSTDYVPATPSHERKTIAGDPYREQLA